MPPGRGKGSASHARGVPSRGEQRSSSNAASDLTGLSINATLPTLSSQPAPRRAVRAMVSPLPPPGQRQGSASSTQKPGSREHVVAAASGSLPTSARGASKQQQQQQHPKTDRQRPRKEEEGQKPVPKIEGPGGKVQAGIATHSRADNLQTGVESEDAFSSGQTISDRAMTWLHSLQLQSSAASKASAALAGQWEWLDDSEQWQPFHPSDVKVLEEALKDGKSRLRTKDLTFNHGDFLYMYDFAAMTQVNCEFGTVRRIRPVSDKNKAKSAKNAQTIVWDKRMSHPSLLISDGGRTVSGEKEDWHFTDNTRAAFSQQVIQAGEMEIVLAYLGGLTTFLCAGVCLADSEDLRKSDGKTLLNMWPKVNDSTHKGCHLYSFYYSAYSQDGSGWESLYTDFADKPEWEEGDQLVLKLSAAPSTMEAYIRPQGKVEAEKRLGQITEGLEGKLRIVALLGGQDQKLRLGAEVPIVRLTRAAALGMRVPSEVLPPWITRTRSKAMRVIPDTAMRGISFKQLKALADTVHSALQEHEVMDTSPYSAHRGERILWPTASMYHICEHFVLPMTKAASCSFAELVASEPQPPQWMVSHAWSTRFACTVQMLSLHSKSRCRGDASSVTYWICTMANNQHDLSELAESNLLDTPFARVLMNKDCVGTAVLCDQAVTPLKRVWCVFEVKVSQTLRSHSVGAKDRHYLDVISTTTAEEESEPTQAAEGGTESSPAVTAAMLQDALQGNFHEVADKPGLHFPLKVALAGTQVDISKAQATVVEDRNAILNYVAVHEALKTSAPPVRHPEYDSLNTFVHSIFASAELYRLAAEKPDGCLESMERLLNLRADPNKYVRGGNTTLFAVVGADPVARAAGVETEDEVVESMLKLLLQARADPNSVNEKVQTVFDCSDSLAQPSKALLLAHGAKPFEDVAELHEESVNASLEEILLRGFPSEGEAFGGSGGGGDAAKLLGNADRCFEEAATLVKRYPSATCWLETLATRQDRLRRRPAALKKVLEQYGCTNEINAAAIDRGSLVSLRLTFREHEEVVE
mmetsp:Transcript_64935/g.155106  ORF Transcript_64935/g.155106 Transcript_64935/m.155106 type:complete len:1037 (+) Transcript_64935:109-3219(+)